ncbi:UNVERIFIED_CONTAM: hypothetical protein P3D56_33050, partial [Pseudomonas aeruginosa]
MISLSPPTICNSALYSATAGAWNGWVWIVGAILYLICLPILRRPFATSL